MTTLKFKCVFTEDDFKEIVRINSLKNWPIFGAFALTMLFAAILVYSENITFGSHTLAFIFAFSCWLLALALAFVIQPAIVGRRIRKNALTFDPLEYEVNDEKIVLKNQSAEKEYSWSIFHKVIETKRLFLLININKDEGKAVPKRVFASIEAEEAFRSILVSKPLIMQNISLDIKKNTRFVIVLISILGLYVLIFGVAVLYPIYNTFR
jgi:hypothetical protein